MYNFQKILFYPDPGGWSPPGQYVFTFKTLFSGVFYSPGQVFPAVASKECIKTYDLLPLTGFTAEVVIQKSAEKRAQGSNLEIGERMSKKIAFKMYKNLDNGEISLEKAIYLDESMLGNESFFHQLLFLEEEAKDALQKDTTIFFQKISCGNE